MSGITLLNIRMCKRETKKNNYYPFHKIIIMKNLFSTTILFLVVLVSSCNSGKNWNETKLENTVNGYQEFLTNNPETAHKDSVLLLIKELNWLYAKTENTIAALNSFLLKYPENKEYDDSINSLKPTLAWDEAFEENTINGYRKFLKDYPESQNRYAAKRKIEKIRWQEVKKINKKADYIEFLAYVTMKNYIDSIDIKFQFKDFMGYQVSFAATEKDGAGEVYEKLSFIFKPNKTLAGFYEGSQEHENYFTAWSGELRGKFDERDITELERRMTEFGDAYEFEPEPWEDFMLFFDNEKTTFSNDYSVYKLIEIEKIVK